MRTRIPYRERIAGAPAAIDAARTLFAAAKESQGRTYTLVRFCGRTYLSAAIAGEGLALATNSRRFW